MNNPNVTPGEKLLFRILMMLVIGMVASYAVKDSPELTFFLVGVIVSYIAGELLGYYAGDLAGTNNGLTIVLTIVFFLIGFLGVGYIAFFIVQPLFFP